ncbi:MAG: apolipoprotein N-acyltransferase, partial [Candidatus Omnitrophica bacterium]|nr:apolipoprotein N-acyltransferase [Candidatus Omnitrophota bacterium]
PFSFGNWWILSWCGFIPLFLVLTNATRAESFWWAYATGVLFWGGVIFWLVHVTFIGTAILVAYLALYFGIFGIFLRSCALPSTSYAGMFFIPAAWVLLEYMRSVLFTGFPWALLGYSQCRVLPVIQVADIAGTWGVSFLVMVGNVCVWQVMVGIRDTVIGVRGPERAKRLRMMKTVLGGCFVVAASVGYGFFSLSRYPLPVTHDPIKISLIQANIPQELKWNSSAREYILQKYFALSRDAAKDSPSLIVWPEASLPAIVEEEPQYLERIKDLVRRQEVPMLLGAVTERKDRYFNSALLIHQDAQTITAYHKLHLVPFGEYIPLRSILPFLETVVPIGEMSRGGEYTLFQLRHWRFAVLIWFEDVFPELSASFVKKGAQFLVNITNDAWYKRTSASYQHLQASVLRAVENRMPLVRAANTGITASIAPTGKIISMVQNPAGEEIFIDGYITSEVSPSLSRPAFYTRFPFLLPLICLCVVVGTFFRIFIKGKRAVAKS